jgi:SAM-dependent methyltransferase
MWTYACTIFLSAFLLFQVQPMIAKSLLPMFGGSAAVWTTCILFFQTTLLLGYLYSDRSIRLLAPKLQAGLHAALLAVSSVILSMRPGIVRDITGGRFPIIRIVALLAVTVGLPYFLLSTTTPLIQSWYARGHKAVLPYRLFALSNLASILALFGYPVVVEPYLSLRRQFQVWSWAYFLFVLLCLFSALRSLKAEVRSEPASESFGLASAPDWDVKLTWMALAACASILLLAVTNHVTQNVAPVPLLWVVLLGGYLLSFALCFEGDHWADLRCWRWLVGPALGGLGLLLVKNQIGGLILTVAMFASALFVCCMFCHSELARLKPHSRFLTSFYLMVAMGGALGGIFVGLIAPMVFNAYFELPVGMIFCAIMALQVIRNTHSFRHLARLVLVAFVGFVICIKFFAAASGTRIMTRNFYGSLSVQDEFPTFGPAFRVLNHGSVVHGVQFLSPQLRTRPTGYYGKESGISLAIENSRKSGMRVGIIGLGTGTLAIYGKQGDYYRFYEINDLVVKVAQTDFTFLRDSDAKVEIVIGDGRLALEREPSQDFDLLAVDAFSGDSIPVHLLTKEAFAIYFRHLKPNGILAVHVSNRFLDIQSVVERLSAFLHKEAGVIHSYSNRDDRTIEAIWVLVADGRSLSDKLHTKSVSTPVAAKAGADIWTDDYSDLFRALK